MTTGGLNGERLEELYGKVLLSDLTEHVVSFVNRNMMSEIFGSDGYDTALEDEIAKRLSKDAYREFGVRLKELMDINIDDLPESIRIQTQQNMKEAIYRTFQEMNELARGFNKNKLIETLIQKWQDSESELTESLIKDFKLTEKEISDLIGGCKEIKFEDVDVIKASIKGKGEEASIEEKAKLKIIEFLEARDQELDQARKIPIEDVKFDNIHQIINSEHPIIGDTIKSILHKEFSVSQLISKRVKSAAIEKEQGIEPIAIGNAEKAQLSLMETIGKILGDIVRAIGDKLSKAMLGLTEEEVEEQSKVQRLKIFYAGRDPRESSRYRYVSAAQALKAATLLAITAQLDLKGHTIQELGEREIAMKPGESDRVVARAGGVKAIRKTASEER